MFSTLQLENMTVHEKLALMESLWDDLCRHEESVPPPAWHGTILADREAAVARGEATFEDWEAAKESIRKELA